MSDAQLVMPDNAVHDGHFNSDIPDIEGINRERIIGQYRQISKFTWGNGPLDVFFEDAPGSAYASSFSSWF